MKKIYPSLSALIGHTPLFLPARMAKKDDLCATLLAKLEYYNPAGSAKDRVALEMIERAERNGTLTRDSILVEPTSGNTGIGLAAVAASRGYRAVIVMPASMSEERKKLVRAYGAALVLTDAAKGMTGAIEYANHLVQTTEGAVLAGQFINPANPAAHEKTTGPEIWEDTDGQVDVFVAGVGTGGTLTGVGRYLKEQNPNVKIIAVEPAASPILSKGVGGVHGIQGIGAGFVPPVLDRTVYDEVIPVTEEDAMAAARRMGREEGILCGISSGAALHAALAVAKREENRGKTVVVLLPDGGERYLSTDLYEE